MLFTGTMVSNRFKNIKDTFTKNLKAVKQSKRSGAGTDNIYKPKWHMFERLMFLQKTCVQGDSQSNISSILATLNSESLQYSKVSDSDTSCTEDVSDIYYYDETLQVNYFLK